MLIKIVIGIVVLVVIGLVISFINSNDSGSTSTSPPPRTGGSTRTQSQPARRSQPAQQTRTASNTRAVTRQNFVQKLNSLADSQDVRVQTSDAQSQLVKEARGYTTRKRRTYNASKETIRVDLSWSENLAELLEVTEVVYTNAQMNCDRRLISERFDYYINLHYRSFTAADLCYAKREEILPCYIQIKKTVDRLRDRNDPLRVDKESFNQLIQLRNTMGSICALLKERVDTLNRQTKVLKDKIRNECDQRGQAWYDRLEERIRQNSSV